ncbi:GGDEF domain-containing protein [Halofilum ochraceum]|uniref:GGDEF domain-containing protein n=1 Tax=Halofilum ochraceum TaxID=1611323 RepID=UPI0009F4E847|nr:GGDEF domain-containing protein [Halofilum ochraceum]
MTDQYLNGTDPPSTSKPRASTRQPVADDAWDERANTLCPLLGHFGVMAIYLRALQCAEPDHPWLSEVREQTLRSNSFAPLRARLSLCIPETAVAVQSFLLEEFDRQLALLIGEPLAQRLLAVVRAIGEGTDAPPAPPADEIAEQLTLTVLRAEADARVARRERDDALRASEQDELTGTANRSRMLDRLKSAIALADRTSTPTAVLFIDLNNFKQINDDMGHGVGDEMLREVGARLQAAVRKTDTVCRYGGDEFVVILTPMERRSEAAPAAARMLMAITKVRGTGPAIPALSASIGIGLYPEHGTTPDALLSRADRAMYDNKRGQHDPLPAAQADGGGSQPDTHCRPGNDIPLVFELLARVNYRE